ncbi:NO-inducible flavohemoprotein [Flammeovirga sp. SubArs3]|uniref:NO-inducible flavohemoprotein n=1 Tax=Flammeovirga sp. SubArs3 TaxID=2995316 RepID=UPI00248BE19D|nr:NO-inducible flavohemoprotein [Flammeovirga sp. SubArs3]
MSINQKTIDIVKATAPVIQEHGVAITSHFYKLMFQHNPELKNVFNMAHQAEGTQPKVLAGAILGYATYIDNLPMLSAAVERIAQKHASLSIQPAQYTIVGKHLIQAIKDVLGEAATPDIIEAWTDAYGILASVFVKREGDIYNEKISEDGGWVGFRDFTVTKKIEESDEITSFYLQPVSGQLLQFNPGQYIAVKLKGEEHSHVNMRNYSLSDAPGKEYYRISVKREVGQGDKPNGIGSNFLHDHVLEGDIIEVGIPAGDFYLNEKSNKDVVLLSGGVGVTPMLSMLEHLVATHSTRKINWIHAAKSSKSHAFKSEVNELTRTHSNISSTYIYSDNLPEDKMERKGLVDAALIAELVENYSEAEYYFCGPKPFMKAVLNALTVLGVKEGQINFEFFGPSEELTTVEH